MTTVFGSYSLALDALTLPFDCFFKSFFFWLVLFSLLSNYLVNVIIKFLEIFELWSNIQISLTTKIVFYFLMLQMCLLKLVKRQVNWEEKSVRLPILNSFKAVKTKFIERKSSSTMCFCIELCLNCHFKTACLRQNSKALRRQGADLNDCGEWKNEWT